VFLQLPVSAVARVIHVVPLPLDLDETSEPLVSLGETFRPIFFFFFVSLHYSNGFRASRERGMLVLSRIYSRRSFKNPKAERTERAYWLRDAIAPPEMERCKLCVNSNSALKCRKCSRFISGKYPRIPLQSTPLACLLALHFRQNTFCWVKRNAYNVCMCVCVCVCVCACVCVGKFIFMNLIMLLNYFF